MIKNKEAAEKEGDKMVWTDRVFRRILHYLVLLLLLPAITSCGIQSASEPAEEGNLAGEETSGEVPDETESGTVAVADFQYMAMPYRLDHARGYTINGEWLYFAINIGDQDTPYSTHVFRKRISDGYLEESYIVSEKASMYALMNLLLADPAGNCYIFWRPGGRVEEEDAVYSLSKYGADGELLWYVDHAPEELLGMGDGLYQGTVTEDGRVFLYTHGSEGHIFAFGEDGALDAVYTPDMEWLSGVAVGKEGKVYAYGSTGSDPLYMEIGGTGETYVCPVYPLEVYSGYEGGICLRTGTRMWVHDPGTGEAELLWNWEDEYMQLDGELMEGFFYDGETCRMLFAEQGFYDSLHIRQFLTFATVTLGDRQDYPGKQTITLSSVFGITDHERMLVKLYNRQSKKYKVEIVPGGTANSLEMNLLQGKGEDLIEISFLYADNLAEIGAFEDLTTYYESSGAVGWEDILEPVREACTIQGRNVAVIPAFRVETMLEREAWYTAEEWTVWEFLRMGQGRQALPMQDPLIALQYCMGIRYGDHFVDYEKRECYFDSDEFRRILEECGKWDSCYYTEGYYTNFRSGEHLLETETSISSTWDMVWADMIARTVDESYSARMVGYPGWDGGEHVLYAVNSFAMNSASENKEGAWDFLEYLLSAELQDMVQYWFHAFPARTDSFEAYLADLYFDPYLLMPSYFDDDPPYEPVTPTQEDIALLRKMVDSAVYHPGWSQDNNQIRIIVEEEAQMYFAGDSPLDETVRKIQNRVQLYLDEM